MDIPSPQPGRPPVFFALTIALLSLGAIGFTAAFLLPKVQFVLTTSPPYEPVPAGGATAIRAWNSIESTTWTALTLTALLACCALLPQLSARFRRCGAWALHGLALLLFLSTLYLAFVAFLGVLWGHMSESRKLAAYRRELEVFALAEAADGRFERMNEFFQHQSSLKTRTVLNEDEMKPRERQNRVTVLVELLNTTPDPRMRRRALATLPFFRKTVSQRLGDHRVFLQHAQELSGQTFADMEALLKWLPIAPLEDGWEPLPMFVIE